MTNITKTINTYIKGIIANVTIYNDLFPDDEVEGLISIHDPTTRILAEYVDGTKELQLNISYTARYNNAATCRSTLDTLLNALDGLKLEDTTDGLQLQISLGANVQFIGTDDKKRSIYTCSISVVYKTTTF